MEHRLLWTFRIRGSGVVYLHLPQGPALHHVGGESLWKALLTQTELTSVLAKLSSQGLQVECIRQSKQDIISQSNTTEYLLSMYDESQLSYRTPECPLCFYFDPLGEHQCGFQDWPLEMKQAAQKISKAVEDLSACKVNTE